MHFEEWLYLKKQYGSSAEEALKNYHTLSKEEQMKLQFAYRNEVLLKQNHVSES